MGQPGLAAVVEADDGDLPGNPDAGQEETSRTPAAHWSLKASAMETSATDTPARAHDVRQDGCWRGIQPKISLGPSSGS